MLVGPAADPGLYVLAGLTVPCASCLRIIRRRVTGRDDGACPPRDAASVPRALPLGALAPGERQA